MLLDGVGCPLVMAEDVVLDTMRCVFLLFVPKDSGLSAFVLWSRHI